ncbi:response regulator [Desulfopila aestuarii]|uniref:Response regulator receiver domain-containing protein n=1 Tax=Desulfopila aestuarii DSM 18488 TaxID=1121416 RepID=A0A1M7Y918_9BACT|nr:response regulator [Desulfopila aestuarii]SHO49134.1 Response regulator receiver domain-containing protein [Desulfopila aestuarii DSM 18488]
METALQTRILLVDDEEEFIATLGQRLETRNLKVMAATSGERAIEIVDSQDVDVIILDLAMPGMDGLEVLRRIKNGHPEAEIIMLTGHATIESTVEAMKLGAEDFLEKPVDMKELLEKIQEAKQKRVLVLQEKSKAEIEQILKTRAW